MGEVVFVEWADGSALDYSRAKTKILNASDT